MAIVSYSDLKEKIPQWAERVDLSEDLIADFIYMAEAECSQLLRVPAMESAELLTFQNGKVTIPFDFMELRRLTHDESETVLQYLSWDQFVEINREGGAYQDTTSPLYYSRQGSDWFVSPKQSDGDTLICHYYRYIPALTDEVPSNWLLKISPQAYLFGGLKYLFEFVMDNERAAYWENKFKGELNKLQGIADRAEHQGTHLAVRSI